MLTTLLQLLHMVFYTYIAACTSRSTLYVGVTDDMLEQMAALKTGVGNPHTRRYLIRDLVYFEVYPTLPLAMARARKLKRWRRAWKNALIEKQNPKWRDLTMEVSFR
ncbi:MAG: GIY-YIG nuclease family protein [Pseudomonadota bacterium]